MVWTAMEISGTAPQQIDLPSVSYPGREVLSKDIEITGKWIFLLFLQAGDLQKAAYLTLLWYCCC